VALTAAVRLGESECVESHDAVTFERAPPYRHWRLEFDAPLAFVVMAVDPDGGLRDDYSLKLNTYDLDVDIELADIAQRLRFEHPEVKAVVLTSALEKVFCAGANIQMLANVSHDHKVNFCKFTNETRNALEEASAYSGQVWVAAVNGTAAGGGYELALACEEIVLVDDGSSAVSLPEVPLLAVLPGTGGLTRVVDKRNVRRDLADVFATKAEGVRGRQALEWGLVDSVATKTRFDDHVRARALARASSSDRPDDTPGIALVALERGCHDDRLCYGAVDVTIARELSAAMITVRGPDGSQPSTMDDVMGAGASWWPLRTARELDDALLHLRVNEPTVGTWVLGTNGDAAAVLAVDELLRDDPQNWLTREVILLWRRVLKRLDVSSRTIVALIDPGSCFAGTLCELAFAADRSFMLDGTLEHVDHPAPTLVLTEANAGPYPMSNGLTRLQSRFFGHADALADVVGQFGEELSASQAVELGLVTFAPDEIDWDDEVRVMLEERSSFSPDALSGLEANCRFVGPETLETKIFARLSAWQNWIFQRPNAAGEEGALRRYGTGSRPNFDRRRV
jgi:benzoyl-CoA-dihydrodiol lyase